MATLGALDRPWFTGITGQHNPEPDPMQILLLAIFVVCFIVIIWR